MTNRPPQMVLVRLRSALVCGGRTHPAGELIRLPADLAVTLWGKARAELREIVQRSHFSR